MGHGDTGSLKDLDQWQGVFRVVSKGDDNQMYDVITSVTLLRFGISCKFSMQA